MRLSSINILLIGQRAEGPRMERKEVRAQRHEHLGQAGAVTAMKTAEYCHFIAGIASIPSET
jgi:hypothetical protein